jgi:DNA polymerase III sliding clamp (beta) subunit (PCNA family)
LPRVLTRSRARRRATSSHREDRRARREHPKGHEDGGGQGRLLRVSSGLWVGRFEIASRLETEKFPAWEEVIPKEPKYELRVSKRALLEALDQIGAAIGERSRGIRLCRVADGLELHGENPDAGTMTTVVEASGWEEGQTIGVNLTYLHNAARFAPSDELRIGITDESSPLMIDDEPYFACVMPVRLKGDDK